MDKLFKPTLKEFPIKELVSSLVKVQRRDDPEKFFRFFSLGTLTRSRYADLYSKEPHTLEWIESFEPGAIFWDVGANVGVYSIYAAMVSRAKVYAFEPESGNYFVLNCNIMNNGLENDVFAYCLALNDSTKKDALNMWKAGPGAGQNSFQDPLGDSGAAFKPQFRQQSMGYSADDWIKKFEAESPNYIKIDVDGIEDKVLKGMPGILAMPTLFEVQVEMLENQIEYVDSVTNLMKRAGFVLRKASSTEFTHSAVPVKNYLFSRQHPGK